MKKIVITGANGYLASLIHLANKDKYTFIPLTRKELSLDNPVQVEKYFEKLDFDIVVHTAADATTAHCEQQPQMTHKINTESAIAIANVCKVRNKKMIFFGSEQSFNGKTTEGPFKENDELVSITNYGKQKTEADRYIQEHLSDFVILRLSWMMGLAEPNVKSSPNIIKNVMNAIWNEKETLFTVNEIRGMTYAKHLANQFDKILNLESGVYHFSSVNNLNTYESAKLIAKKLGISDERIDRYILPNVERYSDRFRDYRLDNTKIMSNGIKLQTFEEDVEECLKDYGWM